VAIRSANREISGDAAGTGLAVDAEAPEHPGLGITDLEHVIAFARAQPEHRGGVAALGYCFGGLFAFLPSFHAPSAMSAMERAIRVLEMLRTVPA
jgi:dienelactone hydrolase